MLRCPNCDFDNELGRIFCRQCGNKLDLSKVQPPTEGAKVRRRIQRSVGKIVRLTIELIILAALILSVVLLALTPRVESITPDAKLEKAVDLKRASLEQLANGRKSGVVTVSEDELNAFFKSAEMDKPTGQGVEIVPSLVRAGFLGDAVKLELAGTIHFGGLFSKGVYLAYRGRPTIANGQFRFEPTGAWIGRMPFHPKLLATFPIFENYFAGVFRHMSDQRGQLEKLTRIQIEGRSVEFSKEVPATP